MSRSQVFALESRTIGGVGIIGGLDNVIIINNRGAGGGWIIGGEWTGLKNSVAGFLVLYVKLNTTLFFFFQQMGTYFL